MTSRTVVNLKMRRAPGDYHLVSEWHMGDSPVASAITDPSDGRPMPLDTTGAEINEVLAGYSGARESKAPQPDPALITRLAGILSPYVCPDDEPMHTIREHPDSELLIRCCIADDDGEPSAERLRMLPWEAAWTNEATKEWRERVLFVRRSGHQSKRRLLSAVRPRALVVPSAECAPHQDLSDEVKSLIDDSSRFGEGSKMMSPLSSWVEIKKELVNQKPSYHIIAFVCHIDPSDTLHLGGREEGGKPVDGRELITADQLASLVAGDEDENLRCLMMLGCDSWLSGLRELATQEMPVPSIIGTHCKVDFPDLLSGLHAFFETLGQRDRPWRIDEAFRAMRDQLAEHNPAHLATPVLHMSTDELVMFEPGM